MAVNEDSFFVAAETSHYLSSSLKVTKDVPVDSQVNFGDLKFKVEILIKESQKTDLINEPN